MRRKCEDSQVWRSWGTLYQLQAEEMAKLNQAEKRGRGQNSIHNDYQSFLLPASGRSLMDLGAQQCTEHCLRRNGITFKGLLGIMMLMSTGQHQYHQHAKSCRQPLRVQYNVLLERKTPKTARETACPTKSITTARNGPSKSDGDPRSFTSVMSQFQSRV